MAGRSRANRATPSRCATSPILALIPALARLIGGWLIGGYTPILSGADRRSRGLCAELRDGVCGGAGRRSPGTDIWRAAGYSRALRLTAYSFTPVWLAGIFLVVPGASFLAILLGLYGFYLMWTGLPVLMQSPRDEACPM